MFPTCWLFGRWHPSTGACSVGWAWVSVRKWQPPRGLTPKSTPQNYHHQCPYPHSEPQPPANCTGDPPILVGRSGPVSYEVTVIFFPGPGAHKTLCVPSKSGGFCFPQTCGIPVIKPCWLSKPDFLGLCCHCRGP